MSKTMEADDDTGTDDETVSINITYIATADVEIDREKYEQWDNDELRSWADGHSSDADVYGCAISVDVEDEDGRTIYQREW